MWRVRMSMVVKYGHFNDVLAISEKLNDLAGKEGWTESKFWIQVSGEENTFVIETDFNDLATYEKETRETYQSDDWMKAVRSNIEHIVEGSVRTEILMTAQPIS